MDNVWQCQPERNGKGFHENTPDMSVSSLMTGLAAGLTGGLGHGLGSSSAAATAMLGRTSLWAAPAGAERRSDVFYEGE